MQDFKFIKDLSWNKWIVLDPRRSKRPNQSKQVLKTCPFCIGNEEAEKEMYRIGGNPGDSNWQIRVLKNKFSFAPVHEIIIHSPDHHKNIDELPQSQVELLFATYKERITKHKNKGHIYVFHNRGELAGESIPHPHSQLIAAPRDVFLDIRPLIKPDGQTLTTNFFTLFCPITSQWPDEVWIVPRRSGNSFDKIFEEEIIDLSFVMQRLLQIMNIRYKEDFPYNFYIAPGKKWYLRFIPRRKIIGGFEVGTGVWVNTQDPKETFTFLKNHFENPDKNVILREHTAEYRRGV
jgi:UDPglucose--hexose-1-phosphate uridylyltransferase